jgi:hypothetical protein
LVTSIVALVALVLLATALGELELSTEGQPLPRPEATEQQEFEALEISNILEYIQVAVFIAGTTLMVLALVYLVVSREAKGQALRQLLVVALIFALLFLTQDRSELLPEQVAPPEPLAPIVEEASGDPGEAVPNAEREFSATPPAWLVWIVASVLALALAAVVVSAGRYIWDRTRGSKEVLEQLAQEAQTALEALQAGADLRDTVLRCYWDMNQVLQLQKGIVRERAMTAREFERFLGESGLPDVQVRRLTRLFEAVRYGGKAPQEYEVHQAMDCLAAIVQACRSAP